MRCSRPARFAPIALAISAACGVLSQSAAASADEPVAPVTEDRPGEVPSRPERRESAYRPPPSVRLPTILGGLGFTAAFWGVGAGTAYLLPDAPAVKYLNRPVIGPWQAVYHKRCDGDCAWTDYVATVWYIFDGLAQAGGLAVAFQGLILPTATYGGGGAAPPATRSPSAPGPRRDDAPPSSAPGTPPPSGPLFYLPRPVPIGQGGFGVGIGGTF